MKIELTTDHFVSIKTDGSDDVDINVSLEQINVFELYANSTLQDVLDAIDEKAEYYYIDDNKILEEIEYEGSIDELLSDPLSLISRLYLETLLKKINSKVISNYPNGVVNGEEKLYGLISFEGDESDEESIKRLKNLTKSDITDLTDGAFKKTVKRKDWERNSDIFIVMIFSTYY
jgi:hypothetical protein